MIIPAIDRTQNSDLPETLEAAHQVILQLRKENAELRQEIETLKELVRERLASAYAIILWEPIRS
jgi:cell division protein FtsB